MVRRKELKEERKVDNSRKSVIWSAVPVAPKLVCRDVRVRGAAAPEGQMTYDSTQGDF